MKSNYEKALKTILHHEGGYVNNPKDPGGETNMGVTKKVYEGFGGTKDMKDLTFDDIAPIYKVNYWNRLRCSQLPSGLDLSVFDWGVNSGTGRAAKKLQTIIGTTADGGIGPNTLKKVNEYIEKNGIETLINEYHDVRQKFYESLSTFETFGKGWTRRNEETRKLSLEMV